MAPPKTQLLGTTAVASMKYSDWPAIDRTLYDAAHAPTKALLTSARPRSALRPATLENDRYAYGRWLAFLMRHGWLEPGSTPAERVNPDRIGLFVEELAAVSADKSVEMYLSGTYRMLKAMHPEGDWNWLARLVHNVHRNAEPVVDKSGLPPIGDLFNYGLEVVQTAETTPATSDKARALQVRDGLAVAILAARPFMRLRDFHALAFGKNLNRVGDVYILSFEKSERKARRAITAPLPQSLTPFIERYRDIHWRVLLAASISAPEEGRLWISRYGSALDRHDLSDAVGRLTEERFGRRITPHLFRNAAADSYAAAIPELIHELPLVLDHASPETSQAYVWFAGHNVAVKKLDMAIAKLEK